MTHKQAARGSDGSKQQQQRDARNKGNSFSERAQAIKQQSTRFHSHSLRGKVLAQLQTPIAVLDAATVEPPMNHWHCGWQSSCCALVAQHKQRQRAARAIRLELLARARAHSNADGVRAVATCPGAYFLHQQHVRRCVRVEPPVKVRWRSRERALVRAMIHVLHCARSLVFVQRCTTQQLLGNPLGGPSAPVYTRTT